MLSSACHDGAEEKLRNWLLGICQSRHRGFRLAVVLQLTCSMALLTDRTAPAMLEDKQGADDLNILQVSHLSPVSFKLDRTVNVPRPWQMGQAFLVCSFLGSQQVDLIVLQVSRCASIFLDCQESYDVRGQDMTGGPDSNNGAKPSKVCFVTIGATASFDRLLSAVLESPFLQALHNAKYTGLSIQYGKEGGKTIYDEFVTTQHEIVRQDLGIELTGFDFNTSGLGQEMRKAKGDPSTGSEEGLVISHAGWTFLLSNCRSCY